MATVASLFVRVRGDASGFISSMTRAETKTKAFTGALTKLARIAGGIAVVGILAIGVASIKAAVDFESAFAGVRKTVDATEAQFAELEEGIKQLSLKMPVAATEIAGVAEAAGQLGVQAPDILEFTKQMIMLGTASDLTSREAATALARFATITQLPISQIGNLSATIVALGNNVAATESEIVNFGLRLAGTGRLIGLSEAEILGFGAALRAVGVRAEAGGTSFSRLFSDLANAVATGGKKLDRFAKVAGLSAKEFGTAFKKDAADAVISFIEGLGKAGEAGENVFKILEELDLNAIRVRTSLLNAAGAGDSFREIVALGSKAFTEGTAAQEEFDKRLKTTASQFKLFKNRLTLIGIKIGQALLPTVLEALDAVSGWLDQNEDRLVNAFVGFAETMKTAFLGIKDAFKAIQPVLATTVSGLEKAFGLLGPKGSLLVGAAAAGFLVGGPVGAAAGLGVAATALAFTEPADGQRDALRRGLAGADEGKLLKIQKALEDSIDRQQESLDRAVIGLNTTGQAFAELGLSLRDARTELGLIEEALLGFALARAKIQTTFLREEAEELQAFKDFMRGAPSPQEARGARLAAEDQAVFDLDAIRAAQEEADALAAAMTRLQQALEAFQNQRTAEIAEAFIRDGERGVAKLRKEFVKLDAEWERNILPGLRRLGIAVPEQFRGMAQDIQRGMLEAVASGRGLGNLLGVLVSRRLLAAERFGDADPRAGLATREVKTGGGTGTVIQIEQLNVGEGAQTTTGEIATGIADGARQALSAQTVGT